MSTHTQTPTGERFFMREPEVDYQASLDCYDTAHAWQVLRDTIERCGASVVSDTVPFPNPHVGERDRIYPRDPLIVLTEGDRPYICPTQVIADGLGDEANEIVAQLKAQPGMGFGPMIKGNIEGGNLVADARRGLLFLGVNNQVQAFVHGFGKAPDYQSLQARVGDCDPHHRRELHRERRYYGKHQREWIEDARDASKRGALRDGRMPYQLVTLFMKDEYAQDFYHLDGAFNVLPTGEAVVCRAVLSRAALHRIDTIFGDRQIEVPLEDAYKGACNFITVGHHVIVPHSPPALRAAMETLGYAVITPEQVGLPEGAWMFSERAGPRCASLKLTPDYGFPDHEKRRDPKAAALIPSR